MAYHNNNPILSAAAHPLKAQQSLANSVIIIDITGV